jgi:hypothetical protein
MGGSRRDFAATGFSDFCIFARLRPSGRDTLWKAKGITWRVVEPGSHNHAAMIEDRHIRIIIMRPETQNQIVSVKREWVLKVLYRPKQPNFGG